MRVSMAGKGPSPLLGYNTNIRRKGVLCHVQTEDSGIAHPHVITHAFTAGTIIGTRKVTYQEHLGTDGLEATVRKLMQQQHKAVCIALRDGEFDANLPTRDTVKVPAYPDEEPAEAVEPEAAEAAESAAPAPIEVAAEPAVGRERDATVEFTLDLEEDEAAPDRVGTPTPPEPSPAVRPATEPPPPPPPDPAEIVVAPPTRPKTDPREWLRTDRETPPPPSVVQSKPQLPADTTYQAQPREPTPVPAPRPPSSGRTPPTFGRTPAAARKRIPTVPPPPRPVTQGRRAPTPAPPVSDDGAGRYSSKVPTLFQGKQAKTQPPPEPPPPPPKARRSSAVRGSIFGQDYISEKSLDEVILAYLSEEIEEK